MKKLLLVAICASAVAAFGADVPVALGEVGVTAVSSSTANTIVAVSYEDLGGGNVTASNLVKTANLTVGDLLYVYNDASFDAFELAESGGVLYWRPSTVVSPLDTGISVSKSSSADSIRIAVGKGVWLIRSNWDGNPFTFYIYGKPVTSLDPVSVTSGTSALVGNPTQSAASPSITVGPNNGDQIIVPASNGAGVLRWKYNSSQEKWSYGKPSAARSTPPEIPAGTGFWYVAAGAVTFGG